MPDIIERQDQQNCVVHAINNALQRVLVSPQDAIDNIKRRFAMIERARSTRKRAMKRPMGITMDRFIAQETRGGLRFDDLIPTLGEHGVRVHMFSLEPSTFDTRQLLVGRWVVIGRYPHFGHAIALCDGHVIESISEREPWPYHLLDRESPWPAQFVPRVLIRLDETATPPTVVESTTGRG